MEGKSVELNELPSRGFGYPKNIEIFVRPISVKEQIDMERYGISDAEYFRSILNGITIQGGFDKNELLHSDVQFLDIVRRLFSFDTKEKIRIEGCVCDNCANKFNYEFRVSDISFSEFKEDIFGKHFILGEGTDDELEIVVSPVTVSEYISLSRQFRNNTDRRTAMSSMYTDYMCACIREVVGREFKSMKDRDSFLRDYINNIWSAKDKKILKNIADETVIKIEPFKLICDSCGRETEVEVTPTSNFQQ